jgi:hypothetical protein
MTPRVTMPQVKSPKIMLVAGSVLAVVGVTALFWIQREREWAHGGDWLKVDVEVALATGDTFEKVIVGLGVPAGEATRVGDDAESVVVRVRWSGSPHTDGAFQVIALDKRVVPPRPLAADGGWNSAGGTGSGWAGAYEVLADRYDWLRGVARANYTGADGVTTFPTAAVDARAGEAGTVTAWFRQWGDGPIPLADPTRELVVALVDEDDNGDVRWARRIFG